MQNKLVFVLLDGLQSTYAKEHLGYLEHLCEKRKAARFEVLGELPSASRPMYETIFTGLPVYKHGIANNGICRLSKYPSIFHLLQAQGRKSMAAAYYWISELYLSAPFDQVNDILQEDKDACIQKGFFYYEDTFPDDHLYSIASNFMEKESYDFVFLHPMNIDDAGHRFGAGSMPYAQAVMNNDRQLSAWIPVWVQKGYSVVIGADHGMSTQGYHGGNSKEQRETAWYVIDDRFKGGPQEQKLTTLDIAPMLCQLLGVQTSEMMKKWEGMPNDKEKQ